MQSEIGLSRRLLLLPAALVLSAGLMLAAYKAKPWNPRPPDSYPARLTSEGVTIAVEPLHRDTMAAEVFDKKDMVTRGIMPLAVVVFNGNDYPVKVEGASIEIIVQDEHRRSLLPGETVRRLFPLSAKSVMSGPPSPRGSRPKSSDLALDDFESKFFDSRTIPAHGKGGGFLYLLVSGPNDITGYFARSRVYIPEIVRQDTGSNLIFFEIEVKPAMAEASATK